MAGAMVLNIGAGTTEVAVVTSYGIITSESIKKGGDDLDAQIIELLRESHNIIMGENTAEKVKKTIASLKIDEQSNAMEISGRDSQTGMPISVDIFASDITEVLIAMADEIVEQIRITLEKTPPELASDIMRKGLFITGGGSQINGLAEYIEDQINITTKFSENPSLDTINGVQIIMKNIDQLRNSKGE